MGSLNDNTLQSQLDAVCASLQSAVPKLLSTTHNVADDTIFRVPDSSDIPLLRDLSAPGTQHSIDEVINDAFKIFDYRNRSNHPRFMAFVPGPVSPIAWLGDCITTAFNSFAGSKLQGSGAAVVEQTMTRWLASRAGMPETAGGVFVSGGSMANLTALALARDRVLPSGKENIGVAYLSDQTHYSVAKALRILGFKKHQIRIIQSNDNFQMDTSALESTIQSDRASGVIPFVVVGTSGTTNTGSVDPLVDISTICKNEGLHFHIDGAFGASACLSATHSDSVSGLGLADSISWDAHKWLFQSYGCGIVLVRDRRHLVENFTNDGDYLRDAVDDEDIPNFWNYGIELTRPARAMRLWFTMRVLGVDTMGQMIDQGFFLAQRAQEELQRLENWEVTSRASLAMVTFRYAPPGKTEEALDALNAAISRRLVSENVAGILTTKLRNSVVLRICCISPLLSTDEMATIIATTDRIAREIQKSGDGA